MKKKNCEHKSGFFFREQKGEEYKICKDCGKRIPTDKKSVLKEG